MEMYLLEGPDLGNSVIYYDGEFEKKRIEVERRPKPCGIRVLDLMIARQVLYCRATTMTMILEC